MGKSVLPAGWPRPLGYSEGWIATANRLLAIAGQLGSGGAGEDQEFSAQWGRSLSRVVAVVAAAGGTPEDVLSLTIYVRSLREYEEAVARLGEPYKAAFGRHFPAMTIVEVAGLVEEQARIEISGLAVIPPFGPSDDAQ